jgi:hypothetical protein
MCDQDRIEFGGRNANLAEATQYLFSAQAGIDKHLRPLARDEHRVPGRSAA